MNENEPNMQLVPENDSQPLAKQTEQAAESLQAQEEKKHKSASAQTKEEEKPFWWILFSYKKTIIGIILAFFLVYFTGVVPVGKIPLLRSLAQWMGYSQEETQEISFLEAFFSWRDHTKNSPQAWERDMASQRNAETLGDLDADARRRLNQLKQASLFNLQGINSKLRSQGQRPDIVTRVSAAPSDEETANAVALPTNVKGVTTYDPAAVGDVFFGADAGGGIARNKQDGYDTAKQLAKIPNPYQVAPSDESSWVGNLAQKAFWADSGIDELLDQVSKKGGGGRISQNLFQNLGNAKSRQDIYYAYLTSRAGARTRNIWLQKTLAAAGFLGADLNRQMLSFSGGGGLTFDEDAVMADMENIQLRLAMEEKCNRSLKADGDTITQSVAELTQTIRGMDQYFPQTCGAAMGGEVNAFIGRVNAAESACKEINDSYQVLENSCQMSFTSGKCEVDHLRDRANAFLTYCQEKFGECGDPATANSEEELAAIGACQAGVNQTSRADENLTGDCSNGGCSSDEVNKLLQGTTQEDFFSTPDWTKTLQNQNAMFVD